MRIFTEQLSRKPNYYPWTEKFIHAMQDNPWNDRHFTFSSDKHDFFIKTTDEVREMMVNSLSCISQIEVSVKTFWGKLGENLPHPSLDDLGTENAHVEVIHNNAYERLLEELDMTDVFEKNMELPVLRDRVKYLRKHNHRYYKDSKKQFLYSLILFTLYVENVSLFWQFYTVSYFNRFHNLFKDTSRQISYTSKEEMIHALSGIAIINQIREEGPELFDDELKERIESSALSAFKAESKLIDWCCPTYESEHLSPEILKEFTKNRFNESLSLIGFDPIFEVDKDILEKSVWFDEEILGNTMTDFFHSKPVEYSKGDRSFDAADLYS